MNISIMNRNKFEFRFFSLSPFFFFSSRRRHTRLQGDWSSDVCSSDLTVVHQALGDVEGVDVFRSLEFVREDDLVEGWGEIGRASCRERVYIAVVVKS